MTAVLTTREVIEQLLAELATARGLRPGAALGEVLVSSLDQMRLLVAIEDRLDVALDVEDGLPFDMSSRQALYLSVERVLAPHANVS